LLERKEVLLCQKPTEKKKVVHRERTASASSIKTHFLSKRDGKGKGEKRKREVWQRGDRAQGARCTTRVVLREL